MNSVRDLPKLLVFAMVARKGSFTRAAATLGLSKSAVSQQITQLEQQLGARLLNRTTRGVALTALGQQICGRCQSLQEQVDLILADVSYAEHDPYGRFAITYPHALENSVVMPALEQLCLEYKNLEPTLVASDQTLDIIEHDLDMAIHAGELLDSSYRALPVGTMTEVFCATPLFLNRLPKISSPEQLVAYRWIATRWQQDSVILSPVGGGAASFNLRLQRFAQASTLPSALALALRHQGFVLLPDVVAQPLIDNGVLVRICPQIAGPSWPVHTLHAYGGDKPIHFARFHQLIRQFFIAAA